MFNVPSVILLLKMPPHPKKQHAYWITLQYGHLNLFFYFNFFRKFLCLTLVGREFRISMNHVRLGNGREELVNMESESSAGSVVSTCLVSFGWRNFRTPFMLMLEGRRGRVGDTPLLLGWGGGGFSDEVRVPSFVVVASRCGTDLPGQTPPGLKAVSTTQVFRIFFTFFRLFDV